MSTVIAKFLKDGTAKKCRACGAEERCGKIAPGDCIERLTVVEKVDSSHWRCVCDCGNERIAKSHSLYHRMTVECLKCMHKTRLKNAREALARKLVGVKVWNDPGDRSGNWTVQSRLQGQSWRCVCKCGHEQVIGLKALKGGKGCRACVLAALRGAPKVNIKGQEFDRLTAVEYARRGYWRCTCKCGNERIVDLYSLRQGRAYACKRCTKVIRRERRRERQVAALQAVQPPSDHPGRVDAGIRDA